MKDSIVACIGIVYGRKNGNNLNVYSSKVDELKPGIRNYNDSSTSIHTSIYWATVMLSLLWLGELHKIQKKKKKSQVLLSLCSRRNASK